MSQSGSDELVQSLDNVQTVVEDIKQRAYWVKAENDWKYINIAMVARWEVVRISNLVNIEIKINDITIKPSSKTDTHFIFDFAKLRSDWFDLMGNTPVECDLLALENACFEAQMKGYTHYSSTDKKILRGCLFTPELIIYFVPQWKPRTQNHPHRLEMTEHYIVSNIHKEQDAKAIANNKPIVNIF